MTNLPLRVALASIALVLGGASALAQVDGGPADADAGAPGCEPSCEGDVLTFCDESAAVTLDCTDGDVEGSVRCGVLSAEWGADCLLGAGAPCDPGYALGLSRCDRAAGLFCIDQTCTAASEPPAPEGPLEPTPGTNELPEDTTTTETEPFSCESCNEPGTSTAVLGGAGLLLLRWPRRLRRPERRGRTPRA